MSGASKTDTVHAAAPHRIVVMGVAGAGKSLIGSMLAEQLGATFLDADTLHEAANVAKMAAGIPLTDDDRWPWLDRVAQALGGTRSGLGGGDTVGGASGLVIACSSLRRSYRDRIRAGAADAFFVELDGSPELLLERIGARQNHFMPAAMLASQLATLEPLGEDEFGARVPIDGTPDDVTARAVAAVRTAAAPRSPEQ